MAIELERVCDGVWKAPSARIIDRSGRKRLAIGYDGFVPAMGTGVIVDKTALIADVLDSGFAATLFCRPRRFGKTFNITMLRAYLESPEAGGLGREQAEALFSHTDVWEADGGYYRQYQGAYPVVHLSLRTAKGGTWGQTLSALRNVILAEYQRHDYLLATSSLPLGEAPYFERIMSGEASEGDYADSLIRLTRALRRYHGAPVVVLIDEYDAPVMAAYSAPQGGYYQEAVGFLKRWLTGALKDGGEALAFACLTGVQRISKESIFSDLNNLATSTPLNVRFEERFGFTDAEVGALATYLGHGDCMEEAREWYDGYRFGRIDVYNPWSVLNYLGEGRVAGVYWGNTSGNSVVGELVSRADARALGQVYDLLEPEGRVSARLDLGVVFPELAVRGDAIWSMLYLSGYLTTDDTEDPSDDMRLRHLRIPDREVGRLFRNEILRRFLAVAGGDRRLASLHWAVVAGDEAAFGRELGRAALRVSYLDLTAELPCHMLLMGLLFGVAGYEDPVSDREEGYGRYDIRLEPDPGASGPLAVNQRPIVTLEVKFERDAGDGRLYELADEALTQIADRAYDADAPVYAAGRLRWGVAFSGKRVAVACARA